LVIVSFGQYSQGTTCNCSPATPRETTRWGGNERVIAQEVKPRKAIYGKVSFPSEEELLVEVFDKPDYLLCRYLPDNPNNCTTTPPADKRRLAACKTGKDGKFCFKNIPPGNYELRVSKDPGWNPIHVYLTVAAGNTKAEKGPLGVRLTLGT